MERSTTYSSEQSNELISSPIDALCRDLRRQYGAAAGTTLGVTEDAVPRFLSLDQDPSFADENSSVMWQTWQEGDGVASEEVVSEHWVSPSDPHGSLHIWDSAKLGVSTSSLFLRKTSLHRGVSDTHRKSSISHSHSPAALPSPRPMLHRSNTTSISSSIASLEEPAHVRHFLQDTPQLRFLQPSSLDMNAAQHTSATPALQRLLRKDAHRHVSHAALDYKSSYLRQKHHQRAATELANLLWRLSHEMPMEEYGFVESSVFSRVFAMVHQQPGEPIGNPELKTRRMAGLLALAALWEAPSADEERKGIKFAYTLSQALRNGAGDFEFVQATARTLGRMAQKQANVDFGKHSTAHTQYFG